MEDFTRLKYPLKSHRKKVVLPEYSHVLAEFFGIMIGDGGINNDWQANITLNAVSDLAYSKYISGLCKKLFRISSSVRIRKGTNTLVVSLASISVVDFLVQHGLKRGNKLKQGLAIPDWILGSPEFKKACVRGLIDTDGCIYIHTHKVRERVYKNIGLTFTNYSPDLIFQVAGILEEFGIFPHINNRKDGIYLYREDSVLKYMKVFGTSNQRIRNVYKEWRDAGVV